MDFGDSPVMRAEQSPSKIEQKESDNIMIIKQSSPPQELLKQEVIQDLTESNKMEKPKYKHPSRILHRSETLNNKVPYVTHVVSRKENNQPTPTTFVKMNSLRDQPNTQQFVSRQNTHISVGSNFNPTVKVNVSKLSPNQSVETGLEQQKKVSTKVQNDTEKQTSEQKYNI